MLQIRVKTVPGFARATLNSSQDIWEGGITTDEAIGELIVTLQRSLGIEISHVPSLVPPVANSSLQIVTKRINLDAFEAFVLNDKGVWGAGKTRTASIGSLVRAHQEIVGVQITFG